MIDVLILGQPFWARQIAQALNTRPSDVRALVAQPKSYARLLASPPRSEHVVIMRVGYRVGATTLRGRIFDAYWFLLRRSLPDAVACHYWLGTDVFDTVQEAQAGTLRWAAIRSARNDLHLAGAPWLTAELESIGILAATALVPYASRGPRAVAPLPSVFSALTYLPADRFEFYGGPSIVEAARRLPGIRFDVVGSRDKPGWSVPPNVHWHGWVADIAQYYAETTVVIRTPRHDGYGGTVREGLLNARHVVYTHEVPFVRSVWPATPENLVAALSELQDADGGGCLGLNLEGRAYALETFDEAKNADHLAALLRVRS